MSAQEKANNQYTNYCAQYADLGFQIDELVNKRRSVKVKLQALQSSVPFILEAEKDALKTIVTETQGETVPAPH